MAMTNESITRIGYPKLCYKCDRTITWTKTRSGKKIMMDFYPCAEGRYVITGSTDAGEAIITRTPGGPQDLEQDRYTCHFDTCARKSYRRNSTTPRIRR